MSGHDAKCELGRTNSLGRITHCWCAIRADYCDAEADERRFHAAAEADLAARIDADNARIRTELHNRLNQLDDTQLDALAHELADTAPDAVNDALNEIGA